MDFRVSEAEPQIAVGRICCDADGRLNQNSILLQVSYCARIIHNFSIKFFLMLRGTLMCIVLSTEKSGSYIISFMDSEWFIPYPDPTHIKHIGNYF